MTQRRPNHLPINVVPPGGAKRIAAYYKSLNVGACAHQHLCVRMCQLTVEHPNTSQCWQTGQIQAMKVHRLEVHCVQRRKHGKHPCSICCCEMAFSDLNPRRFGQHGEASTKMASRPARHSSKSWNTSSLIAHFNSKATSSGMRLHCLKRTLCRPRLAKILPPKCKYLPKPSRKQNIHRRTVALLHAKMTFARSLTSSRPSRKRCTAPTCPTWIRSRRGNGGPRLSLTKGRTSCCRWKRNQKVAWNMPPLVGFPQNEVQEH